MTLPAHFNWHADATLHHADSAVPRPAPSGRQGFRAIPTQPTQAALTALAQSLVDPAPFCLSDGALPAEATAGAGEFLTLTGGTSGHPKAIRRTQASWIASFQVNAERLDLRPGEAVAVLGGLNHSLALYGLLEALHLGLSAHALDALPPSRQRAYMTRHKIDVLYATPAQLRLLCRVRAEANHDLRLILSGGGPLDADTHALLHRCFPQAALRCFYGAAETSFITMATAETPEGAVGPAYPGVTIELRDETGTVHESEGEIWVRSPYLCADYATAAHTLTRDARGFVTVGELGQRDAEGNLWIRGRRSRMLTIADHNVFPEDVEAVLCRQPGVTQSAVLPVPDHLRGHRLVAVIEGDSDRLSAAALREACQSALPAHAVPHRLLFHPRLPMLPSGKIDLSQLALWLEAQR